MKCEYNSDKPGLLKWCLNVRLGCRQNKVLIEINDLSTHIRKLIARVWMLTVIYIDVYTCTH